MGPRYAVPTSFPGADAGHARRHCGPCRSGGRLLASWAESEEQRAGEPREPAVRGEGTHEMMKCPWLLHRGTNKANPQEPPAPPARLAVTKQMESMGRWDRRPTPHTCVTVGATIRCDTGPGQRALGACPLHSAPQAPGGSHTELPLAPPQGACRKTQALGGCPHGEGRLCSWGKTPFYRGMA